MRIISRRKEYYDYISHQYGGGDPKVVYIRDTELPKTVDVLTEVKFPTLPLSLLEQKIIVILGKVFCFVRMSRSDALIENIHKYPVEWVFLKDRLDLCRSYWFLRNNIGLGEHHPEIDDLCVRIKVPVFAVHDIHWKKDGWKEFYLDPKVPDLTEYGFPSRYPAEQIYQDIALHLGKQISVDVPVALTDKERIVQAGFDLKSSFRNVK